MSTETTPRSRRWIWYFVAIGLAAAMLTTWLALYIRSQLDPAKQLTLEQLHAVRKLWEEKGPKNYQMLYKVWRGGDSKEDTYFVEVRNGQAVSVVLNGQQGLEPSKLEYHSMPALFNDIEIFLKRDLQPASPQTFRRGYFDTADGHLLQFERQVIGGQERVKIQVETFKPIAGK